MSKENLNKATHQGELELGDIKIPCYVLEDGKRVLSGRGMQSALNLGQTRGQKIPQLVDNKYLKPLVSKDLELGIFSPIEFKSNTGFKAFGYEATSLVDLCDLLLQARKQGVLPKKYLPIADQAETLTRSFAKVGIIALVDEATGYQYDRERKELQRILKQYISEELLPWQKRFPDEFYIEIFRLNGWDYTVNGIQQRPGVIGTWTKQLIYAKLPRGVLRELIKKTPKSKKGNYSARFHQSLTVDVGHPHLEKQLVSVITLMNVSNDWDEFLKLFNKKFGQLEIAFDKAKEIEPRKKSEETQLSSFNQNLKKLMRVPPPHKEKGG